MPDIRHKRSSRKSGGFFGALRRFWGQKFTIMFVPHSEKKTVHIQISLFSLILSGLLFLGLLTGFFWFSLDLSGKGVLLTARSRALEETEASLDDIRDEVGELINSAGAFKNILSNTMDTLGLEDASADSAAGGGGGDLASLFAVEQALLLPLQVHSEVLQVADLKDNSPPLQLASDCYTTA